MAGSEVERGVLPSHELLIHNLLYQSATKAGINMSFRSAVVCRKKLSYLILALIAFIILNLLVNANA